MTPCLFFPMGQNKAPPSAQRRRMSNACDPRPVRRVPGQQPFGFVNQGGDRAFGNLTVASDVSIGSQATIPLVYAEELASSTNLQLTACDNLRLLVRNVVTVDAPSVVFDGNVAIQGTANLNSLVVANLNISNATFTNLNVSALNLLSPNASTPAQLLTRDSASGAILYSNINNFPSVPSTLTLALNPASGNVALRGPATVYTAVLSASDQTIPTNVFSQIAYATTQFSDPNVTVNTVLGTEFNINQPGVYAISVQCALNSPANVTFSLLPQGTSVPLTQTGSLANQRTASMTFFFSTAIHGTLFGVYCDNSLSGSPTILSAGLNSVSVMRLY